MSDDNGWKRGEKGFAKDKSAGEFLKPKFDDKKLYGPTHGREEVGARAVTGGKYGKQKD